MTELSNYVATLPDGQERLFPDKFSPKRWENVRTNEHIGDFRIELKEMEKESSAELYQIELSILPSRLLKAENAQHLTVSGYFAHYEGLEVITLGSHSRDALLEVITQLKRPVLSRGFGGPNGLQGMVPRLAVQVDVPGMMNALVESLDGYEFEFLDSAKKSLQRFGENKVGEVISTLTFAENGVEIAIDADLCLLRMVPMEE
jgi:hypothetical protein